MRKLIIALLLVNGIIWFIPEHTPDPAIEVADAELNEETISVRLDTEQIDSKHKGMLYLLVN